MLLVVCPSYVPLGVRLRLGSGLTSLLKASTLFLWVSLMYAKCRGEPRTCVDSYRELGGLFSSSLLSGSPPPFLPLRGPFPGYSGQKIGVYLRVLATHPATRVQICNWHPPLGQRWKRKETKKGFFPSLDQMDSFFRFLWPERWTFYLSFSCSHWCLFTAP